MRELEVIWKSFEKQDESKDDSNSSGIERMTEDHLKLAQRKKKLEIEIFTFRFDQRNWYKYLHGIKEVPHCGRENQILIK